MQNFGIYFKAFRHRREMAATLLCAGMLGVFAKPAMAEPILAKATQTDSVPSLRQVAGNTSQRAADLEARPAQWVWTDPSTVQVIGQAAQSVSPIKDVVTAAAPEEDNDLLDEVSVTATRRPAKFRETTATIYSIKKEDMQAQGARTATDALQLVPGITTFPQQGGAGGGGIFLRGFDDQRFTLLRDGISIQRVANGRTDISRFSLENVERIEVINGGAALRYGSGSVGGVINLITETPSGSPKLTLKYESGSYGFNRYVAKYGGGDDTFSYNFLFESSKATNDYPYSITLPNQARFYGPTVNQNASVPSPRINPSGYPNGKNSFGVGGTSAGDSDNNSPIDLFGYLRPEVGPPITVTGTSNVGENSGDTYGAKFTFKPDPANKITFSANEQTYRYITANPGSAYRNACFGGASIATNPVLALNQFSPVDSKGNILPCDQQRYIVRTPTSGLALPFNYNTSVDGKIVFPTGQSFGASELSSLDNIQFAISNQSQTDIQLQWDWNISPTTSLSTYASWYQFTSPRFVPQPLFYDTNVNLTQAGFAGPPGQRRAVLSFQPFVYSPRLEFQTQLNTQISPGQNLSVGANFIQDSSFQQPTAAANFFDKTISRSSAFIVDDISFGSELKANVGIRYTYSTQFGAVATPALGVRYSPNNTYSLRANWSQVFNAPAPTNLFTFATGFSANPNLQPETGITYDVGVDITPAPNLAFRLTYFNSSLDGIFTTVNVRNPNATTVGDPTFGFNFLATFLNLGSRRASGIEFSGDWKLTDQWQARVVWTNQDARPYGLVDNTNQATFPYFFEYQDPLIPFNSVTTALTYTNPGLRATLLGRYNSGQRRNNATDFTSAYATLDLNLEVPISEIFTLTGNIANLTGTNYELFPGAPAPGTTFRVGGKLELSL
jgi:iron complex outermembrane recepter protein